MDLGFFLFYSDGIEQVLQAVVLKNGRVSSQNNTPFENSSIFFCV